MNNYIRQIKLYQWNVKWNTKFENLKNSKPVFKTIKGISDQIKVGEFNLFEFDPVKAEEDK